VVVVCVCTDPGRQAGRQTGTVGVPPHLGCLEGALGIHSVCRVRIGMREREREPE